MKFDKILFSSGNLISMGAFLHAFDSFYFKVGACGVARSVVRSVVRCG